MPKLSKLGKKSKRKWASTKINEALVKVPETPLQKYYQRAVNCNDFLQQHGQKVSSSYCNARTCLTCSAIRTAKYLNFYGDQVKAFKEPVLVTLTKPTVWCIQPETLRGEIGVMFGVWRLIYNQSHKAPARRAGIKLTGIRALEVTQRPGDQYHGHFHFEMDGMANAEWLVKQWLIHFPDAKRWAQDIRPITGENGLVEVLKYSTKFVGEELVETISQDGKKVFVKVRKREDAGRTDLIIQALRNKQLVAAFGGLKKLEIEDVNKIVEGTTYEELEDVEYRFWRWCGNDWYASDTGEKMTTFEPSDGMKRVFE
jgi:predicted RNA-binding protein with RPS1 domain